MNKILFLPQDYQAPKSTNLYMKFQEGENKFRILSQPVLGWEDWQDKKPIRFKLDQKPLKAIDPKKPIKHFWAMIVWNYSLEEIQILHLTQSSIRKSLEALCLDPDWGAPYFYDLKIMKTGEGLDTEYSLNPIPHKPLAAHIKDLFKERPCNLEALFYNDDPFSKENSVFTPGVFSELDVQLSANNITKKLTFEQTHELEMILDDCDQKYKEWVYSYIKKQYNTENISDLPVDLFIKMRDAAYKNMEENHARQRSEVSQHESIASSQ